MAPTPLTYQATFDGQVVTLTKIDAQIIYHRRHTNSVGTVSGIHDQRSHGLMSGRPRTLSSGAVRQPARRYVVETTSPTNCVTADFVFTRQLTLLTVRRQTTGSTVTPIAS